LRPSKVLCALALHSTFRIFFEGDPGPHVWPGRRPFRPTPPPDRSAHGRFSGQSKGLSRTKVAFPFPRHRGFTPPANRISLFLCRPKFPFDEDVFSSSPGVAGFSAPLPFFFPSRFFFWFFKNSRHVLISRPLAPTINDDKGKEYPTCYHRREPHHPPPLFFSLFSTGGGGFPPCNGPFLKKRAVSADVGKLLTRFPPQMQQPVGSVEVTR